MNEQMKELMNERRILQHPHRTVTGIKRALAPKSALPNLKHYEICRGLPLAILNIIHSSFAFFIIK